MLRTLVLIIAVALVVIIVKRWLTQASGQRSPRPRPERPQRMVRCQHCGLHVPEGEAIADGGRFYCSEEHRRLHSS